MSNLATAGESFGLTKKVTREQILKAFSEMSVYYIRARLWKWHDQRLEFPSRRPNFLDWVKEKTGQDLEEIRINGVYVCMIRNGFRSDPEALLVQLRKVVFKLPDGTLMRIPDMLTWSFPIGEVLAGV